MDPVTDLVTKCITSSKKTTLWPCSRGLPIRGYAIAPASCPSVQCEQNYPYKKTTRRNNCSRVPSNETTPYLYKRRDAFIPCQLGAGQQPDKIGTRPFLADTLTWKLCGPEILTRKDASDYFILSGFTRKRVPTTRLQSRTSTIWMKKASWRRFQGSPPYFRDGRIFRATRQSEWVSVIECIGINSYYLPGFVIFKGKQIQENRIPNETVLNVSENGWTDSEIALDWIKHFDAYTKIRTREIQTLNSRWTYFSHVFSLCVVLRS